MKPSIYRRIRRRATHDTAVNKKENKQEQSFFANPAGESFFHPAPVVQRKCDKCEEEDKKVQRVTDKKEEEKLQKKEEEKKEEKLMKKEDPKEEDKKLQKKDAGGTNASPVTSSYINSLNGKGTVLPQHAQQFFGERMGHDFSNVKVHTDKAAADSAKEVNAQAYTIGNNIVFNEGRYNVNTAEGKKLLAHELTHVLQQNGEKMHRAVDNEAVQREEELPGITTSGVGSSVANKIAYGNCQGVRVQGRTVANYDHGTYAANSSSVRRASNCAGCTGNDCATVTGTIVSVFQANPQVTLPAVPAGLSECERQAVQTFIDTTLNQHEQEHVAAFNTYNATVNTPFTYTGCRDGFDAYINNIHNGIDAGRVAAANALSDALDPFNATIPCNCPEETSDAGKK